MYLENASDPAKFIQKQTELLGQLTKETVATRDMYATGKTDLDGSNKLYGLAQRTRDLSSLACGNCPNGTISELSRFCKWKQGGRIIRGSCNMRYETYEFF